MIEMFSIVNIGNRNPSLIILINPRATKSNLAASPCAIVCNAESCKNVQ